MARQAGWLEARPGLRWLAPVVVLAVVATAGLMGSRASADVTLPELTAQQLLTKVAESKPDGFSGTVEQSANLGLPDLSGMGDGQSGSDFTSLVSGTHTLRVAYAAPDKTRVAVQGTYGESDLISDGTQQWLWSSDDNTVVHRTGSAAHSGEQLTPPTPADAASRFLTEVGTSTDVTLARNVTVADRPSYELVLTPKADQTGTLIRSVRLAVDGETFVPLRAQVFAAGDQPVFSTGFTSIDYQVPADSEFTFTPPKDATVKEVDGTSRHERGSHSSTKPDSKPDVTVTGDAWTTVVVSKVGDLSQGGDRQADQILQSLPRVSGGWGSGRLLAGTAFSAVLTDDGRLAVGPVTPDLLYAALR